MPAAARVEVIWNENDDQYWYCIEINDRKIVYTLDKSSVIRLRACEDEALRQSEPDPPAGAERLEVL